MVSQVTADLSPCSTMPNTPTFGQREYNKLVDQTPIATLDAFDHVIKFRFRVTFGGFKKRHEAAYVNFKWLNLRLPVSVWLNSV